MSTSSDVFLNGEGDNWYERNKQAQLNPTVLHAFYSLVDRPTRMLEVGCGDGRYIGELHRIFGGHAAGIDPSAKAIAEARHKYKYLEFIRADAVNGLITLLPGPKHDLIVFGFCLYILDRKDLFNIVSLADLMLMDGGYIAVHDFLPSDPYKVPYKHHEGLFSYKMDYAGLWLASPTYRLVSCTKTAEGEAVKIIQKVAW